MPESQKDKVKQTEKKGASAVSDGYSKTWHLIFMIAGNGHFQKQNQRIFKL
jgi:hypothetical protein